MSSQKADPGLSKGWAYFVEETAYKEHIERHKNDIEPVCCYRLFCSHETSTIEQKSTCSQHGAVNLANASRGEGNAASGIGKVVCARHDMKLPSSVGDLQVGERYAQYGCSIRFDRLKQMSLVIVTWIICSTRASSTRSSSLMLSHTISRVSGQSTYESICLPSITSFFSSAIMCSLSSWSQNFISQPTFPPAVQNFPLISVLDVRALMERRLNVDGPKSIPWLRALARWDLEVDVIRWTFTLGTSIGERL